MGSRWLHVTNGESAARTLRRTGLDGAVLPWDDVLHEGPVPAVPRQELLRVRAAFLSECGWGSRSAILATFERRDRRFTEALRAGVQVVVWFEHDLYDQLQLLDALALARESAGSLELIVVDSFPGRPRFRGLGELSANELEALWPARAAVSPGALGAAAAAWEALRAPEPVALARWAESGSPDLPLLGPALLRLLEELPAPADGLSGTERRALQAVAGGARTQAAVFVAAQELEEAPFLGDDWFARTLAALGRGENRLVETRGGELRLTRRGEEVLAGAADRVDLLGVDRWVGGTHLTPDRAWRWDPAARRLVTPA